MREAKGGELTEQERRAVLYHRRTKESKGKNSARRRLNNGRLRNKVVLLRQKKTGEKKKIPSPYSWLPQGRSIGTREGTSRQPEGEKGIRKETIESQKRKENPNRFKNQLRGKRSKGLLHQKSKLFRGGGGGGTERSRRNQPPTKARREGGNREEKGRNKYPPRWKESTTSKKREIAPEHYKQEKSHGRKPITPSEKGRTQTATGRLDRLLQKEQELQRHAKPQRKKKGKIGA